MAVRGWFKALAILVSIGIGLAAAAAVKVRVTVDSAGIKATPEIGSPTLASLPLGTILDVDSKQGEWYKVTTTKDGAVLTGYIHELLVEQVGEGEAEGALSPSSPAVSQAEIIAGIELQLAEIKTPIRQAKDLDKAADALRPLLAKAFGIEDRARQRQIACEIYLWLGLSYSKRGDSYAALREFLNMFEVDYAGAKEATRNIIEPEVSSLIDQADKQARGLLVDYSLEIVSEPKEASIRIDGREIGFTPEVYRTPVPKLKLEIVKEGYRTYAEELFLAQPSTRKEVVLESLGRPVLIGSVPSGARVFIDGRDSGRTTDGELPYVPYGSHVLTLRKAGWADGEQAFEVLEGTGPLEIRLPLTAAVYSEGLKMGGPGSKIFKLPKAVAFDKEGNFYVADESDIKLKKYTPEGRLQATWGDSGRALKSLKKPAGIAFDGRGDCYVTDAVAGAVFKLAADGKSVAKWGRRGARADELMTPLGIAVDGAGDIYVADSGNNRIVKYSPAGGVKKVIGKPGQGVGEFNSPAGVAVTPQNDILVLDRFRVQKFSSEGAFLASFGKSGTGDGELNAPRGLAADALGYIYVADAGNNRIQKFDAAGHFVVNWGSAGTGGFQLAGPVAVAVNAEGRVLVVETGNARLVEFKVPSP